MNLLLGDTAAGRSLLLITGNISRLPVCSVLALGTVLWRVGSLCMYISRSRLMPGSCALVNLESTRRLACNSARKLYIAEHQTTCCAVLVAAPSHGMYLCLRCRPHNACQQSTISAVCVKAVVSASEHGIYKQALQPKRSMEIRKSESMCTQMQPWGQGDTWSEASTLTLQHSQACMYLVRGPWDRAGSGI